MKYKDSKARAFQDLTNISRHDETHLAVTSKTNALIAHPQCGDILLLLRCVFDFV